MEDSVNGKGSSHNVSIDLESAQFVSKLRDSEWNIFLAVCFKTYEFNFDFIQCYLENGLWLFLNLWRVTEALKSH